MTRTEARQILDDSDRAIGRNVRDLYAGRIDYETFHARQIEAHAAIDRAGQGDHWRRRWRRSSPSQ